ncbi:MAG: polyprenyl synthetase family protein [Clostridia bacterium]|nr:polyprenyl synthetase family protein [Clostridia bacterium]
MVDMLEQYRSIFDRHLQEILAQYNCDIQPIAEALKYGISNGGKRIRPILCYMGAELCGKDVDFVKNLAVGIEMIHSYSLVHDDLPCMDDDSLRRGKPTMHIVYGEGMAVLAGDALLNCAFEVMLGDGNFDSDMRKAMVYIAKNTGINGMIGGQCLDLANETKSDFGLEELTLLNSLKTSCLIKCALVGSVIRCGASKEQIKAAEVYSENIGQIFQLVDDILDRTSSSQQLGKDVNRDEANGKKSIVDIIGMESALNYIDKLEKQAIDEIDIFRERSLNLKTLCKFLSNRTA